MMGPTLLLVATFGIIPAADGGLGRAATPEQAAIIQRHWYGRSVEPAEWIPGGQLFMEESLDLTIDSNDRVTGKGFTRAPVDGIWYAASYRVEGRFDGREGLTLTLTLDWENPIPGHHFCSRKATLEIHGRSDREGHFLMKGTLVDACDSGDTGARGEVQYLDEPY